MNNYPYLLTNKKNRELYYLGVASMILCFIIAGIFQYHYTKSPENDLEIKNFQTVLNKKLLLADEALNEIKQTIEQNNLTLNNIQSNQGISFYIYQNDSLFFWTENEIAVPEILQANKANTSFEQLQGISCVYRSINYKQYLILALVRIKNNYADPNDYLKNDFEADYGMDNRIEITYGTAKDAYAIFSPENEYLFSLNKENIAVYNKTLSVWSMIFWVVGLCILYLLSKNSYLLQHKKKPRLNDFLVSFFVLSTLIYLGIRINEPWMMFSQDFFSPIYYASGSILNSLGSLTIVSVFLLAEISFLYRRVTLPKITLDKKLNSFTGLYLNLVSAVFFAFISWLFNSIIYNASFEITLYKLENISAPSVIAVMLIISWISGFILLRLKSLQVVRARSSLVKNFISNLLIAAAAFVWFFFVNKNYCMLAVWYIILSSSVDYIHYKNTKINLSSLAFLLIVSTALIVHFSVIHSNIKLQEKYKALAENISSGDVLNRNIFSEILFEEMDKKLKKDSNINKIALNKTAGTDMQAFVMDNYFRGFWSSNYDIKTYIIDNSNPSKSDLERKSFYDKLLKNSEQVKQTAFYYCSNESAKMDYIGKIPLNNVVVFIEFHSKLRSSSYSYPEPLLNAGKSKSYSNTLSIARYKNNSISSQIGEYEFPKTLQWVPVKNKNYYAFSKDGYMHFVFKTNQSASIVISQPKASGYYVYIVFGAYLLALYFFLLFIFYGILTFKRKQSQQQLSFLSRLQTAFIFLLIISFLSIFLFSITFTINQYKNKQSNELKNKTKYIKKYIQESLKQYNNLAQSNTVDLNFFLQDLSNTYETDIHIYDEKGFLVATSQPIIFSKGLLSYRISPNPFFTKANEITQTEYIGELSYLASYTEIFNENNELMGYISVPSFLSSNEIQKQVFSLLAVIINVYLFIIFIALLVSFIVNNQLSKPIKALENKIKSFSLKGYNEKLVYLRNDEIGRLVSQYNLMIEKLEKSADKLAQSEREVAWKQMARQITHEINNPLTPMKLSIQQLQRMQELKSEAFEAYFSKTAQMLIEQIENLSRIASSFSDFAKMPEAKQERVNIIARIESVVNLFAHTNEAIKLNFKSTVDEAYILADKEQLTQVFNNLIKNAIQAIPTTKKGIVTIKAQVNEKSILIEIKDNGAGIEKEAEKLLFSPNFTTKSSGMGLGLAIVKNIVEGSGGKIWFKTKAEHGTSFFLEFYLC